MSERFIEVPGLRPRIIGIAGASGSGKTYLASHLADSLGAPVVSIDSYYCELGHVSLEERSRWNFDHPDALDWPLLREQLCRLGNGLPVDVPVYDFATHTRSSQCNRLQTSGFLVLEGIFALYDEEVRRMLALGIFVDYGNDGCFERRLARDVVERGRTPECVTRQYVQTVRPMYSEFIAPTREHAQLLIAGDAPVEASLRTIRGALNLAPPAGR